MQFCPEIQDEMRVFYCPAGKRDEAPTDEEIKNHLHERWQTFDQFKERAFGIWIVTLPVDKEKWIEGRYTCVDYFKSFCCKHIIVGLAIRLKYTKPPSEARNVPIGHKRKRGRPAKATRALLVD